MGIRVIIFAILTFNKPPVSGLVSRS